MTDKSQTSDTEAEAAPALKPLPQLKVIRDTYCSQEMTDACIKYLEEHRPDLVQEMLEQIMAQNYHKIADYYGAIGGFIIKEASKEIEIPSTRLGRIDLFAEMFRRFYRACGKESIDKPYGRPLASGPGQKLPPLGPIKLENTYEGVTQELLEQSLHLVYEQRPDILYELSEEFRRGLLFSEAQAELYNFLQKAVENELKEAVKGALGVGASVPTRFLGMLKNSIRHHIVQMVKAIQ